MGGRSTQDSLGQGAERGGGGGGLQADGRGFQKTSALVTISSRFSGPPSCVLELSALHKAKGDNFCQHVRICMEFNPDTGWPWSFQEASLDILNVWQMSA